MFTKRWDYVTTCYNPDGLKIQKEQLNFYPM
jgi:hypothetical protein